MPKSLTPANGAPRRALEARRHIRRRKRRRKIREWITKIRVPLGVRKCATPRRSDTFAGLLPGNKDRIILLPGGAEDSRFPAAATETTTTTRPRAPPEGCKATATAAETSLVNSSSSNPRVHCQRDPQVRRTEENSSLFFGHFIWVSEMSGHNHSCLLR